MEQTTSRKKVILSGIQPTGVFTLGNYLGAIKNWVVLQEEYDCAYMIADLHSITVRQEPAKLRQQTLSALATLLACGIDPQKSLTFIQSQVPQHAELAWVLSCYTQFGELSRMTQFKDKSAKHADNVNAGLFTYPALMAADILLYQADLVPVGVDQKQHLELTRDVALRFNNAYSETFTLPDPYIPKMGAKIMSLADPAKKMSKSDENPNGFITILDEPDAIIRKFKRAVTDSDASIRYAEGKDGVNNLMTIYSIIKEFEGKGDGDFKLAVGEVVSDHLKPVRDEHKRLMDDKAYLEQVYTEGAQKAQRIARKTLNKVYRKVGFVQVK